MSPDSRTATCLPRRTLYSFTSDITARRPVVVVLVFVVVSVFVVVVVVLVVVVVVVVVGLG